MMSSTITNNDFLEGISFSSEDYTFNEPKVNASGGKAVGIVNKHNRKALVITTPLMLTWGVNEYVDESSGRSSYDMALQFPKSDYATPETTAFLDNMIAFQDSVKEHVKNESKKLLNKAKVTDDVVDALFHPMLNYRKDPNTGEPDLTSAPTLKIKLPYWDNKFDIEIYDANDNMLFGDDPTTGESKRDISPKQLITKGAHVATMLRFGGIWFANGKFGATLRLVQTVVKPPTTLKGKCHIRLSTAERSRLEAQSEADKETESVDQVACDDSDDDESLQTPVVEEVASAAAATPEPPKPKKKKVVRRVKKTSANTAE